MSDPSFNTVAQSAHFFSALSVAVLCQHYHWSTGIWLCAAIAAAAIKEFWYDYKYETPAARGSSFEDFLFYMLGLATGLGLWHL